MTTPQLQRRARRAQLVQPDLRVVVIYCRISKDKRGDAEGVEEQERRGREFAARMWPDLPVIVFVDNDMTAYTESKRDDYERMMEMIAEGSVAHVVVQVQSRLTRLGRRGIEEFIDDAEIGGVETLHTYRGQQIWTNGGDRVVPEILAVVERNKVRIDRKAAIERHEGRRRAGRPHLGKPIYGYRVEDGTLVKNDDDDHDVYDDEVEVIERCVERVLAGWSLQRITDEMIALGVATRMGGRWRSYNVGKLLRSPTLAGLRVDDDGVEIEGTWDAIIPVNTWRQVVAKLDGRGRRLARPVRKHLLSGFARCTSCGGSMYGVERHLPRGTQRVYECHRQMGGCGRVSIAADLLDDAVLEATQAMLDSPTFAQQWGESADAYEAERTRLNERLDAIGERRAMLAEQAGDVDSMFSQAGLDALPAPQGTSLDDVRDQLNSGLLDEQRAALALVIDHVPVEPSLGRRGLSRVRDIVPRQP